VVNCKNKTFKKICLFAILFFMISFFINTMMALAVVNNSNISSKSNNINQTEIKIQQEKIIDCLERMDEKL